jgi:RNA polymerase sigma-70 factor, ECF subfamily
MGRAVPDHTPPVPDSDEDLLARLRTGERAAFAPLVKRYERELFGYLRRYLGDDDLAEDVFQNTFVQVYLKIKQYELGRAARPWLYAIATNQAIDALRRRARRAADRPAETVSAPDEDGEARPLFELLPAPGEAPPEAVGRSEERERVRAAVARLPELLRRAVLLVYFQGLKYQEAAEILDIPVGTVKSRLHAALMKLAEDWEQEGRPPEDGGPVTEDRNEGTGDRGHGSAARRQGSAERRIARLAGVRGGARGSRR